MACAGFLSAEQEAVFHLQVSDGWQPECEWQWSSTNHGRFIETASSPQVSAHAESLTEFSDLNTFAPAISLKASAELKGQIFTEH